MPADVIFKGIDPETRSSVDDLVQNIATIFRVSPEKAQQLLNNPGMKVKGGLQTEVAQKMANRMRSIGLLAEVVVENGQPAPKEEASGETTPPHADPLPRPPAIELIYKGMAPMSDAKREVVLGILASDLAVTIAQVKAATTQPGRVLVAEVGVGQAQILVDRWRKLGISFDLPPVSSENGEQQAEPEPPTGIAEETKKCPACAETILAAAKKCRYCGEVLDPSLAQPVSVGEIHVVSLLMQNKQMMGVCGSAILFVGVFLPLVSVPVVGSINYFFNGRGDGVIVMALALASLYLTMVGNYRRLWVTGGLSLATLCFTFFFYLYKFNELQSQLEGNPFKDLAMNAIHFQWGWAVLVVGALLVLAAAAVGDEQGLAYLLSLSKKRFG